MRINAWCLSRVPRLSDIAAKAFGPPAHAVTFGERGGKPSVETTVERQRSAAGKQWGTNCRVYVGRYEYGLYGNWCKSHVCKRSSYIITAFFCGWRIGKGSFLLNMVMELDVYTKLKGLSFQALFSFFHKLKETYPNLWFGFFRIAWTTAMHVPL